MATATTLIDVYDPKVLVKQNYFKEDYTEVVRSFIYEQYKNSPNLIKYMGALLEPIDELQGVMVDILNFREVQNAFGKSLDTIGEIVGKDRPTYNADTALFFGFSNVLGEPGPIPIFGFGTIANRATGGIFRFLAQPSAGFTLVGDNDYRGFIATQIQENNFDGTINGLLLAIESFFENPFSSDVYDEETGGTVEALPFAYDDALGPVFPEPHSGFGDATDPTVEGGHLGDSTANNTIYVKIEENFDVLDRYISMKFFANLTIKQKSFLRLNEILPKIAGVRYVYEDYSGIF